MRPLDDSNPSRQDEEEDDEDLTSREQTTCKHKTMNIATVSTEPVQCVVNCTLYTLPGDGHSRDGQHQGTGGSLCGTNVAISRVSLRYANINITQ